MPKHVALPDGSIGEFPDSMDDSAIEGVLRKQFGPTTAPGQIPTDPRYDRAPAATTPEQQYGDRPISDQISGGIASTLNRTAIGLKGLLPSQETTDDDRRRLGQHRAFVEGTGPASTIAEIGTDIGLSAAPIAQTNRLASALRAGRGAPVVADVAANAAYSAATAPEERGEAAMYGGGGAVIGRAAPGLLGRFMRPTKVGPEAQRLIDAGIQPTFGQVLSEKGGALPRALARAEESATSVPLAGAPIRRARERSMDQFQKASREAALPPGAGREAAGSVDELGDAFNNAYNSILRGADFLPERNPFDSWNLEGVISTAAKGRPIPAPIRGKAQGAVESIMESLDAATMRTPQGAHVFERRLKDLAYKYKSTPDPDAREYGELLHDVAQNWRKEWRGALPTARGNALGEIDKAFASFVPVRRAAATGNLTDPDAYTPRVLLRSIRAGDKSPNKRSFVAGGLPQQDLATAANKVLGNKVPDTGAAERLLLGGGLSLGSAIAGIGTPAALSGAALAIYGTAPVQRYLTSNTAAQKWLQQNLGKMSPQQQEQVMRQVHRLASQVGRATAVQQGQR